MARGKISLTARAALAAGLAAMAVWWTLHTGGPAPPAMPEAMVLAAPDTERVFPRISPFGPGLDRDAARMFAESRGLPLSMLPTETWAEALALVRSRQAQAAVSPGLASWGDSRGPDGLEAGPAYAFSNPVVLHHFLRLDMEDPMDVCGAPVFVQNTPGLRRAFADLTQQAGCPHKKAITPDRAGLDPSLAMLDANNTIRFTLVDKEQFSLWQPFYPRLRPTMDLPRTLPYRWYWPSSPEGLSLELETFWTDAAANGTVAELIELYQGFLPERTDYYQLHHLRQTVLHKLPIFVKSINKAAGKYGLDPLFLAAVVYQESGFDTGAQSRTGVRGLMQITKATAEALGLEDRTDAAASILAGARYLRTLWEMLGEKKLAPWNRWFFALAAYNQGYGHVRDAMDLARNTGRNPASWRQVKEVFPLLAWKRYYEHSRYGYTRGWEAVEYVDKVRYYYYVLTGLAVLPGLEAQKLAPLARGRPVDWP